LGENGQSDVAENYRGMCQTSARELVISICCRLVRPLLCHRRMNALVAIVALPALLTFMGCSSPAEATFRSFSDGGIQLAGYPAGSPTTTEVDILMGIAGPVSSGPEDCLSISAATT
jgi:hypothetical protein